MDKRKCCRKQKRAHHRLMRDMNIESSDEPTEYVMICNAGLVTGLRTEELENILNLLVSEYDIIMPPEKSYCFVRFYSNATASIAYNKIHGNMLLTNQTSPLYAMYTKTVPDFNEDCSQTTFPPGLKLIENFITLEDEKILLESIDWGDQDTLKHRKVKHFGYEFSYKLQTIDTKKSIEPIPEGYKFLTTLFHEHGYGDYDQLTINSYFPGQGIPPHVDTHSMCTDTILSLSLGSSCVMDFKREEQKVSVFLPARSLLVMKDEARYAWTHGICPRHYDVIKNDNNSSTTMTRGIRISFTFRKILREPCNCGFIDRCDSKVNNSGLDDDLSTKLESLYVHRVYEEISDHFNETRHKQWPNVIKFLDNLKSGDILIDVGCGNGKYLHGNNKIYKIGCDRSFALTEISRKRGFQVLVGDCLHLPYKDNVADAVICIAVIHHLTTDERRKKAIQELIRILRPNGRCLIYVWAKEQTKNSLKSNYLKQKDNQQIEPIFKQTECGLTLPVHENRTEFTHSDMLVPWKKKSGENFLRFYHVFQQDELFQLCSNISNAIVQDLYYEQGNWCTIMEKKELK